MGNRERLRILFLLPFPPRRDGLHGGSRVIAEVLLRLSRLHTVAVVYLRDVGEAPADEALGETCDHIESIAKKRLDEGQAAYLVELLRSRLNLFRGIPLWASELFTPAFEQRVRLLAKSWRPDIVQVEYAAMGRYLAAAGAPQMPSVVVDHDPVRERTAPHSRGFARIVSLLDSIAWRRFQQQLAEHADAVAVFTERDRRALSELVGEGRVVRVPLGASIPERSLNPIGEAPPTLLFVGSFVHPPNIDAARRLALAIFPRLRPRHPTLRLSIVGHAPPQAVRELASHDRISVAADVPDITPHLDRACVVVAPLRLGGGMRIKVLEALAAGKAVVASTLAAEGIDVADGQQLLLADDDAEFCDAIEMLLEDAHLRRRLATAARDWAVSNLDWQCSVAAYERLYTSVLAARDEAEPVFRANG